MKFLTVLMATLLVSSSALATEYQCSISQSRYATNAEEPFVFATGKIAVETTSKPLAVDVSKNDVSNEKVRVVLEIGPSFDKSKLYVHYYAIDKKGSKDPGDFKMVFDNHTEIDLATKSISMRSSGDAEELSPTAFSCELVR
jgi:hypothetical protein